MTHHAFTLLILCKFFPLSNGLWNCVLDSSLIPKSYFCSSVEFHTALFYLSPIKSTRLLISITSADITYNVTKGFNWRSVDSSSTSVCETVETQLLPGICRLDSICLLNPKREGSYRMQLKVSEQISVPILMYAESSTSLKSRFFTHFQKKYLT